MLMNKCYPIHLAQLSARYEQISFFLPCISMCKLAGLRPAKQSASMHLHRLMFHEHSNGQRELGLDLIVILEDHGWTF